MTRKELVLWMLVHLIGCIGTGVIVGLVVARALRSVVAPCLKRLDARDDRRDGIRR